MGAGGRRLDHRVVRLSHSKQGKTIDSKTLEHTARFPAQGAPGGGRGAIAPGIRDITTTIGSVRTMAEFTHPVLFTQATGITASQREEWRRRWPAFAPGEVACRGTGMILVDPDHLDRMQRLRAALGRPVVPTSWYRSPQHNAATGSTPFSMHPVGRATDFLVGPTERTQGAIVRLAAELGFTGIGTYPKGRFIHVDTRRGGLVTWEG